MLKKIRLILFVYCFILLTFSFAFAGIGYEFINSNDTSYASIKRGVIRIRIKGNIIPSEVEFKKISSDAWKKYRGRWKTGTVFMYVKDMPANSMAYAASEFEHSRILKFWVNNQALEVHEYSKRRRAKTAKKQPPGRSGETENHVAVDDEGQLKIGKQYTLKKRTPLMPGPSPEKGVDGLIRSLKKAIYLKPSDTILITMKKNVGSTLWYGVMAYNVNADSIGTGWINSTALIGQGLQP